MAVTRADKETELQELERAFAGTDSAIVVDYKGLKVPEATELRRQIRGAKATYKVVKNTLAKRAMKGTSFESLTEFFTGPGKTILERSEIVESIDVPLPTSPAGSAFGRLTRRRGVDLATINMTCVADADGVSRATCSGVRTSRASSASFAQKFQ